ncbi:MAG TPA: hypothetical protein PLK52_00950 [Usitatibacteraceae bacterium]|jgi:hypothetical protein|nr:hypothetical protein [Usitatibacteraceae bacterium]HRA22090.1 hypothetical protein [Usitatibacteraceae bacterium]
MRTNTVRLHWFFVIALLVLAVDLHVGLSVRVEADYWRKAWGAIKRLLGKQQERRPARRPPGRQGWRRTQGLVRLCCSRRAGHGRIRLARAAWRLQGHRLRFHHDPATGRSMTNPTEPPPSRPGREASP